MIDLLVTVGIVLTTVYCVVLAVVYQVRDAIYKYRRR